MNLVGDFSKFYGIDSVTDSVLEEQLVENLIGFFDWAFLGIGAFYNVLRPSNKSKFKIADDPNFEYGRVWEAYRGNWVWEPPASINYPVKPLQITGLYKDNVFVPVSEGSYYLDYRDGQIIFNEPIDESLTVEMEYSYRRFNFYDANADWFQEVIFDALSEQHVTSVLSKNRVYLPAVIVEIGPTAALIPYELGNLSVREQQVVLFHILSDNDEDWAKIVYILKRMYGKTIWLYDINKIADENKFGYQLTGELSTNPLTYPELVGQFAWKRCTFIDVKSQENNQNLPLFRAVVRATLEVIMP